MVPAKFKRGHLAGIPFKMFTITIYATVLVTGLSVCCAVHIW